MAKTKTKPEPTIQGSTRPRPKSVKQKAVLVDPDTLEKVNGIAASLDEKHRYIFAAAIDSLVELGSDRVAELVSAARRRLNAGVSA